MNLVCTSDDVQAADDVGPGQDAETAGAWAALEDAGIVPESVALSDYVKADADVIVYKELSVAEITKSATAMANSSDGNKAVHGVVAVQPPATTPQVMDFLKFLHSPLGTHDDDVAMQLLTECEQHILP